MRRAGVASSIRFESRKLRAQLAVRLAALIAVLAPLGFGALLRIQSGSPADALFGVWVHSSGAALSLVVLGFAGSWGFPMLAGVVAGDVFSSEDRYGTWKMVLTRSRTRRELFWGKVLAAYGFAIVLLVLALVVSLLAGVVFVGAHAQVGLSGQVIGPGRALWLTAASWLLDLPPMLAFASLAMLVSIATRNGIIGVIGPLLAALVMQLLELVGRGVWVHTLLMSDAVGSWHALFTSRPYYGQLIAALVVSFAWILVCLSISWWLLRRRDFLGAAVPRRAGWVMPVRVAVAGAISIAVLAIATNWGPVGVTRGRLQASITPTFDNLIALQQSELGNQLPPGAVYRSVPQCVRRASTPSGPGDWICTFYVPTASSGASSVAPESTPVSYDVSIQADGCYKAGSPPAFVAAQTMRDSDGNTVINPLFTIYGCFNVL